MVLFELYSQPILKLAWSDLNWLGRLADKPSAANERGTNTDTPKPELSRNKPALLKVAEEIKAEQAQLQQLLAQYHHGAAKPNESG